jgi:hypothetical protein
LRVLKTYRWQLASFGAIATPAEIARVARSIELGRLAFVFGAGVSIEYPSLLPMTVTGRLPGLVDLVLDVLQEKAGALGEPATCLLRRAKLEHLLDHLHRTIGDEVFKFLTPLGKGRPNLRHHALAMLCERFECRRFMTVNFDTLFEDACARSLVCPEKEDDEER